MALLLEAATLAMQHSKGDIGRWCAKQIQILHTRLQVSLRLLEHTRPLIMTLFWYRVCLCFHLNGIASVQVEDEMRELLSAMEQQKASSAVKVKQLATILQDMQAPAFQ